MGIGTGIWWAATITANAHSLEVKSDAKLADMNKRLDKLEETMNKVLEHLKAK